MRETPDLPLLGAATDARAPGLVWAYAAGADGRARRIGPEDIPAALAEAPWVWLHVDAVDQRLGGWFGRVCDLGPAAAALILGREGAGDGFEPRPGEVHGTGADFLSDFERLATSVGRYAFAAQARLLVTARRHPLSGFEAARRALEDGARPAGGFGVLALVASAFARAAALRVEAAQGELDEAEDRLLAFGPQSEAGALKEVRRLGIALHRPIAGMAAAFAAAAEDEDAGVEEADRATLEGVAARLAAVDAQVVQLNDRARLLQEEAMAEVAQETNRSLRLLTVMSALMLPGTLVAGLFGMNVPGVPFEDASWGFAAAVALAGVGTAAFLWLMIRAGLIGRP